MSRPSFEEVQDQAKRLRELKPRVRHFTAFGDDNWAAIDAQVQVLERDMSTDRIYREFERGGDSTNLIDNALDARAWMDGEPLLDVDGVGDLVSAWAPLARDE